MKKKFYVTTPIYYPNDIPHIGHAYTTIAGDILARWHKIKGEDVFFLVGTDEHAKKVFQAAEKKGIEIKKFVDGLAKEFEKSWKKLNLSYDKFIRTTDKDHITEVIKILEKVYKKRDIYKGIYEGHYCTGCEAYYTEKDLENGCCPIHKTKAEKLKEESYFFKLSKYQNKLLKLYEQNPDFIKPKNRRTEIINRVKKGLKDLSISRKDYGWGIKLPFDKTHVCYVWFDALFNYYSGGKKFWPADVHLIGKDILWFHAVIWPAMLISAGIKLPKTIFAHGWWTLNKQKISKSRGKVINIEKLISIAGVDSARYFLFRETPFGKDGDFSEKALINRHNNELADKLGHLVSRVSSLIEKNGIEKCTPRAYTQGGHENLSRGTKEVREHLRGPETFPQEMFTKGKNKLIKKLNEAKIEKLFDNYEFDKVLNTIFAFIDVCNEYVQKKKPWETGDKKVLYELKESILKIAELLSPFIPESSEKIIKQFSAKKIKKSEILFKKIK